MKPTKQQNEALFGPSAPSDYAAGDTIHYQDGDDLREGTVLFTRAAGPVREGGPELKQCHFVDTGRGWPKIVYPRQVVE